MGRALASTNLDLDCKSAEIIEGGTLDVKVKGHWDGNLHVWWYTSDGTAKAGSDYPELVGVKQGSRKSGNTMTRTIETLDNLYPELNETFNLRFSRQDNHSDDTSCVLTIKDDDKGVRGMVISSSPADGLRYRAGEVIEFALHMNADVYINRILPPQISMDFRMGSGEDNLRQADIHYPDETTYSDKRVVYVRYTVQVDDLDTNGVYVSHGDNTVGLTGSLLIYQYVPSRGGSNKGDPITKYYRGRHFKDGQVDGRPWVKSLDVISTPPDEETYYRTDEIELQLTFSEPMDVTGEPGVGFFIGGDDEDAQRQATYDRGSGTGTPVFKYTVQEEDTDGDGITVANGWKTNGLELDEGESIVSTDNDAEASRYYKGIHDPLEDHKVDGSRSSSPVFVSGKTNESGNRVTVTFSKDVSPPSLLQTISDLFGVSLGRFYASVFDIYAEHTTRPLDLRNASLSDDQLTLHVNRSINKNATVKVAYNNLFAKDSVGMFRDSDGNNLENFDKMTVTNNSNQTSSSLGWPYVDVPFDLTVDEGGTKRYGVRLSHRPTTTQVIVNLSVYPSDALTLSKTSLNFNPGNYSLWQYVNITAPEDDDTTNMWARITHTPSGSY